MEAGFPWATLPVIGRDEARLAAWIAAVGWTWRSDGGDDAASAGADAVIEVRSRGARGWVVVPGLVVRAIADRALARGPELAAPRPTTAVERALAALVVADAVARDDASATVALIEAIPTGAFPSARGALAGPVTGEVLVVGGFVALAGAPARATPAVLPPVRVAIEAARAEVLAARLREVATGDVVVVGPPSARIRVGRGSLAATLDRARGTVTVAAPYLREATMIDDPATLLAADLPIAIAIVVGDVTLPAAEVLALTPGRTVALGRPVGGLVELRAGGRLLGRGELVVVDGDLGVRLIEVLSATPPAC